MKYLWKGPAPKTANIDFCAHRNQTTPQGLYVCIEYRIRKDWMPIIWGAGWRKKDSDVHGSLPSLGFQLLRW